MAGYLDKNQIQEQLDVSPFIRALQIEAVEVNHTEETLTLRMPMGGILERLNHSRQIHGGPIASFIDIVGCYTLIMVKCTPLPTINFRTDYLRPAVDTDLLGHGKIRRAGRSIGVTDIDVVDKNAKLVAVGRGCFSLR